MSLLREILAEAFLLREDASVDAVNNAVKNMHPARIIYDGPSDGGNGVRTIYPVAYGISTAGNPVVRAFQPQGSTSSDVPSWKFFRLDRIKSWENDNSATFDPKDLNGFNDKGDEQIETLYSISPIGKTAEKPETSPEKPEKILTNHPVTKGEVENGGADKNTEEKYYTANDAIRDVLQTSDQKMAPETNKNVDKMAGHDYNSKETQPARAAFPVTKGEIAGPNDTNEPSKRNPDLYGNDGPVTKDEVEQKPVEPELEEPEEDPLASSFKDLNDRMNSLYNDEEEEENK